DRAVRADLVQPGQPVSPAGQEVATVRTRRQGPDRYRVEEDRFLEVAGGRLRVADHLALHRSGEEGEAIPADGYCSHPTGLAERGAEGLASRGVPCLEGREGRPLGVTLLRLGQEPLAVRGEGEAVDQSLRADEPLGLAGLDVPEPDGL